MIGKRLAMERKRLGLTQEALAAHLGIGRPALAMMEIGRSTLDVPRLLFLGESLGFDVIFVLTGEPAALAGERLMDWVLWDDLCKAVKFWCKKRKVTVSEDKERAVVRILYRRFAMKRGIVQKELDEIMEVAA